MPDRRGFFETLLAKPAKPLSRLARFTSAQGIFYTAMGGAMIFSPAELLTTLELAYLRSECEGANAVEGNGCEQRLGAARRGHAV